MKARPCGVPRGCPNRFVASLAAVLAFPVFNVIMLTDAYATTPNGARGGVMVGAVGPATDDAPKPPASGATQPVSAR